MSEYKLKWSLSSFVHAHLVHHQFLFLLHLQEWLFHSLQIGLFPLHILWAALFHLRQIFINQLLDLLLYSLINNISAKIVIFKLILSFSSSLQIVQIVLQYSISPLESFLLHKSPHIHCLFPFIQHIHGKHLWIVFHSCFTSTNLFSSRLILLESLNFLSRKSKSHSLLLNVTFLGRSCSSLK